MGSVGSAYRASRGPAHPQHQAAWSMAQRGKGLTCKGGTCGGSGGLIKACWSAVAPVLLLLVICLLVIGSARMDAWAGRLSRQAVGTHEVDHFTAVASTGDLAAVRDLLHSGIDPNLPGPRGITPLMCAAQTPNSDVLEFLILSGADVDARDVGGFTALMAAVRAGRMRSVELLVRAGADAGAETDFGRTAMDLAQDAGDVPMQRLISEALTRQRLR